MGMGQGGGDEGSMGFRRVLGYFILMLEIGIFSHKWFQLWISDMRYLLALLV